MINKCNPVGANIYNSSNFFFRGREDYKRTILDVEPLMLPSLNYLSAIGHRATPYPNMRYIMPAFSVKGIGKNRGFTAEKCEFLYTRSTGGNSEVLEELLGRQEDGL